MPKIMNNITFANLAKDVATKYKTLYIMGCFGSPMNNTNKNRYCNNHSYNKQSSRTNKIKNASADTFGFDCVCLIKGLLWGWCGNVNKTYGGAVYASNGVPDVNADGIMSYCTNVSTDFRNIEVGELVHMKGHVGIYIGNGLAVECTPIWKDGVQITAVGNIGKKNGYNTRTWTNHGKLNFIEYIKEVSTPSKKTLDDIAKDVISGKYGNYPERKMKLEAEGYNYSEVQSKVNQLLKQNKTNNSTIKYIVRRGDTLSYIAKKYGTTWQDIYNKNKTMIDNDAKRHGAKNNYHNFIYEGQVLTIK